MVSIDDGSKLPIGPDAQTALSNFLEGRRMRGAILAKFKAPAFSAPCCYIDQIILRYAKKLYWTPSEVETLRKYTPDLLWSISAFNKTLETITLTDKRKQEVEDLFKPLRKLVNPVDYFSVGPSRYGIADSLLLAAKRVAACLAPASDKLKKDSMESVWWVYKNICFFHDLTESAMLLSNTVGVPYVTAHLPDFFGSCKKDLHSNLQKYRKPKYTQKMVGVDEITKNNAHIYMQVFYDNKYAKLREALFKQTADVLQSDELNWEKAKIFMQKRILSYEKEYSRGTIPLWEATFQELIKSDCNLSVKSLAQKISQEEKKAVCYCLYSQLIDGCISLLEAKVMECFVKHSIHVFRAYYEMSKGGNSI